MHKDNREKRLHSRAVRQQTILLCFDSLVARPLHALSDIVDVAF